MKTLMITLLLCAFPFLMQAQDFETAMLEQIDLMNEALYERNESSKGNLIESANTFDRIAQAETEQWLPLYYSAYSRVSAAMMEEDTDVRDKMADEAQKQLDKAMELEQDNSELVTLQAYIYIVKITVSPMMRGMTYSSKINKSIDKAVELDPTNPRPHSLKGQNTYYTPGMFGGGPENACPHFHKAQELFEQSVQEDPLMPDWGRGSTQYFLEKCNKDGF